MSRVGLSLRGSLRQSATSSKTVAPRRIISLPGSSQRRYNSTGPEPSQKPGSSSRARSLAVPAAVGFGIGLATVVFGRGVSADDGKLRCDGAPAIEFVDTHGYPWKPVDAYEHDDPRNPMRIRMATWVKELQDHIVTTLEAIEASHPPHPSDPAPSSTPPPKFLRDAWIRPEGGEGSSCVLANGRVFEKAGVNVSIVHGQLPPAAQRQMRADHSSLPISTESMPFFATGLSIVIHPRNPHVPTVHLNYRYFEVEDPKNPNGDPVAWWFGGGSDLTPSYTDEGDIKHFHSTLKDACDKHDKRYWNVFKPWCDKYFYITHRNESRGVGGIFFDDLTTSSPIHSDKNLNQNEIFSFVKDVSSSFLPSYVPIVWKNKDMGWTEEERRWQLLRRGRYVEFNLVHDRGTKFGLMTPGARIESILMSLPETARWEYMSEMGKPGTKEGDLIELLKNPREWA